MAFSYSMHFRFWSVSDIPHVKTGMSVTKHCYLTHRNAAKGQGSVLFAIVLTPFS